MRKWLSGLHREVSKEGFRYRGLAPTRLENLSDAIFGFSITLLVISSQVPTTYLELQTSMYNFVGFIFCTMLILGLWDNYSSFYLHYGLHDQVTKGLNALFLFVLLYYVYPLKYLFSFLGTSIYVKIMYTLGDQSEALFGIIDQLRAARLQTHQWKDLMLRFGFCMFLLYGLLFLMHGYAYRRRTVLELNQTELVLTKMFVRAYALLVLVAVVSMLIVLIFGGEAASYSGMVYALIPFLLLWNKRKMRKELGSLE